jgi:hypothetical protein
MRDLSALLSARTNYPGEQTEQRAQNEILQRQPLSVAKRCQISHNFLLPCTQHSAHSCTYARLHACTLSRISVEASGMGNLEHGANYLSIFSVQAQRFPAGIVAFVVSRLEGLRPR